MSSGATASPPPSGAAEKKSSVSFGFAKVKQKSALVRPQANFVQKEDKDAQEETDYVREVNHKDGIKGTKVKVEKKELVIPCQKNTLQMAAKLEEKAKKKEEEAAAASDSTVKKEPKEETEDDLAERELLKDVERWKEEQDNKNEESEHKNFNLEVAMNGQGTAENEVDDVTGVVVGKESSLDDYDSIPVQGFGMGMLRGMGFKADEGIGGFKKANVKCIEPVQRPKGLGLGASRASAKDQGKAPKDEDGEELKMEKGAYLKVESGAHKELYGTVEGVDGEASRVFVKLAVGGQTVSVSENAVRLVGKKEFKKYSKVINKDMYDKYKEKQERREVEWDKTREDLDSDRKKRRKSRSRSRSPAGKKYKSSSNGHKSSSSRQKRSWVRPLLRVRFIDDRYKSGKYYNTKVVVEDVAAEDSFTVRTDRGVVIDEVRTKQLETVIPKNTGDVVMILAGKRRGHLAELIGRDKKASLAAVQLLPDKDEVLKIDFDDVCEYTGEVLD